MRRWAYVSSKDRKLVLTKLGVPYCTGNPPVQTLSLLSSSHSWPYPSFCPSLPLPLTSTILLPTPNCLPQQDTRSGVLGLGVVEGRHVLQGASGVPTEGIHQAPGGTQGAAGQLAPGGDGDRNYKG